MPVYEYHCEECGPFTRLRGLDQCSEPFRCPECGCLAPKVFSTVQLRSMRPENRVAWERNERSAHAPHVCGSGCSHSHAASQAQPDVAAAANSKPTLQTSTNQHRRPWML
jgi:putative FmdB family regulatory protein